MDNATKFRAWGNQDFGTAKPKKESKQPEGMLVCMTHGMRGGVPFREPVKFTYEVPGTPLTNGRKASKGVPVEFSNKVKLTKG